ncbi:site-specific DNA-methyltransferase [Methanosarcinales archaeon]|nr:MAG: site-specific DNA-methyltransferase [Methanosarcinales archaeon]
MPAKEKKPADVKDYRYDEKRKNNPPAGMASYEPAGEKQTRNYAYDPHLSPQLIWAEKPGLRSIEMEDASGVEAETISLHVHERISTQAILKAVRKPVPKQMTLFADPQLPLKDAVQFYQHDIDWTNRLILGDSLLVANSLIEKELMAGKVQMIYMDPPYGVKYSSNFQPKIDQRDVKDKDNDLTREPEQIKAYRDTWKLGIHSYLTYMRDRLRICRELLTDSGSIFVQISDENVHLVRCLMDEVFGAENFVALITFRKKFMPLGAKYLEGVSDYLLLYANKKDNLKLYSLFEYVNVEGDSHWNYGILPNGKRFKLKTEEISNHKFLHEGVDIYQLSNLYPAGINSSGLFEVRLYDKKYYPPEGNSWKTNEDGFKRLIEANRIEPYKGGKTLRYILKLSDYPVSPITNLWDKMPSPTGKVYVVQTATEVIARCILMTTDPGDLVFDPTCGSGTTAYVAEQWGRRWITCDTSRVATSIARQRLLTATYPNYKIEADDPNEQNPKVGFVYKTVPHITLKSIAQNTEIDSVAERFNPLIEETLHKLKCELKQELKEWEVPFEPDGDWSDDAKYLHTQFIRLKREKQTEIDRIIQEYAPQEILYDQPEVDQKTVRVSGPFTVEAIPPPIYEPETPIGGAPGFEAEQYEGDSHIAALIDLLRKDGVTFHDNKKLILATLTPRTGGVLHAEGEAKNGEEEKRYAFSFGPLHGPVSVRQVEDGLREAHRGGYNVIIFCGFAFDPEAQAAIEASPHPRVKAMLSHIRPDVIMTDAKGGSLLKTTASSQLFTVFGEPDIELVKEEDGENFIVRLLGVDVYDPLTGQVNSENAGRIAAWFIDTDYDRRTFCVAQAFFPDKSAWKKLERALKGTIDHEKFEMLTGQESLPFKKGESGEVAIKVIDQRGNEVMKVMPLV